MLKSYGIIKEISGVIAKSAEDVTATVLADFSDISGREEELTSQLRGEINRHLLSRIRDALDGTAVRGCTIAVSTLKKREEAKVGADLVGVIEISTGPTTVSKAFLVQAKVGSVYQSDRGEEYLRATSNDLVRQAKAMLRLSSDSFVFVYSKAGIACVPAYQVVLANSNTVDTGTYPFHSVGRFFEECFKCFVGDHKISPVALKASNLEDYAAKLRAKAALVLTVKLNEAVAR